MNARRLLTIYFLCNLVGCLWLIGNVCNRFITATRHSYHVARRLERETDRVIRRWERGFGETTQQELPFRRWPSSQKDSEAIIAKAPYVETLRGLWEDQPGGLCFRYPRGPGEKCQAVNFRGDRWGWYVAGRNVIEEATESPLIYYEVFVALLCMAALWLTVRMLRRSDDDQSHGGDDGEPWDPPPRWPGRQVRPATPVVHGWN